MAEQAYQAAYQAAIRRVLTKLDEEALLKEALEAHAAEATRKLPYGLPRGSHAATATAAPSKGKRVKRARHKVKRSKP